MNEEIIRQALLSMTRSDVLIQRFIAWGKERYWNIGTDHTHIVRMYIAWVEDRLQETQHSLKRVMNKAT